jgi:cob(I)alamin adenosyltransferase
VDKKNESKDKSYMWGVEQTINMVYRADLAKIDKELEELQKEAQRLYKELITYRNKEKTMVCDTEKLLVLDKKLRRVNRDITDLKKIKQLAGTVEGKEQ